MTAAKLYTVVILGLLLSAARGHMDRKLLVRLQERLKAVEQRNTALEDIAVRAANGGRFIMENVGPVAFTARIDVTTIEHMATNDTIRFEHELLDIGHGYDNQTGVFTAPLPGIYMFSCSLLDHNSLHSGSGVKVRAEIMQEDTALARVFAHADGTVYRDQGAQTIVVHVPRGDRVYVRIIDNQDLTLGGKMFSTFSGYLLWQV